MRNDECGENSGAAQNWCKHLLKKKKVKGDPTASFLMVLTK